MSNINKMEKIRSKSASEKPQPPLICRLKLIENY